MIDLKTWKPAAMAALKAAFGERLLCLGLQGELSARRGYGG